VAVLCHYFMLSFVFVNADSLQPMLLQERFKIMQKDQFNNGYNTELLAFDISVKVFTAPLLGYLCDRIGRRNILLYGFLCIALAMGLMPFAAQFYQLVLLRSFYAQGAIAISVVPLLADYVHPEKKGVASSLCVFMSACGALSSAYVNYSILSNLA
jgi:MFS family permease